jgi:hypothetical protein
MDARSKSASEVFLEHASGTALETGSIGDMLLVA